MSTESTASGTNRIDWMNAMMVDNWWVLALRGLLAIVFGISTFVVPVAALLSLVLVFAAFSLADGVLGIVAAVRGARRGQRWGWLVFSGIMSILAGIAALFWPHITVLVFVTLIAVWAVFSGVGMLVAAFQLKTNHGRWWLVLGGVASIIYGGLLLVAPFIGALVLTWWLGAHALILGATLIVLAFRLRSHRGERPGRHTATPAAA
ncbi:MAG TPA: HdeD family acid-resistance protein [Arsenicitalea sp.]|jgi:uncharacterized membrane protein HdeD (DUF308 family)|nr:HdeD family acid-resistance protein [Arsenicitalea sp.]